MHYCPKSMQEKQKYSCSENPWGAETGALLCNSPGKIVIYGASQFYMSSSAKTQCTTLHWGTPAATLVAGKQFHRKCGKNSRHAHPMPPGKGVQTLKKNEAQSAVLGFPLLGPFLTCATVLKPFFTTFYTLTCTSNLS